MNEAIIQTLQSKGWAEIEAIIREEFLTEKRVKTDGKTDSQIASEVKGREYCAKAINRFLARMDRLKNPPKSISNSYK